MEHALATEGGFCTRSASIEHQVWNHPQVWKLRIGFFSHFFLQKFLYSFFHLFLSALSEYYYNISLNCRSYMMERCGLEFQSLFY